MQPRPLLELESVPQPVPASLLPDRPNSQDQAALPLMERVDSPRRLRLSAEQARHSRRGRAHSRQHQVSRLDLASVPAQEPVYSRLEHRPLSDHPAQALTGPARFLGMCRPLPDQAMCRVWSMFPLPPQPEAVEVEAVGWASPRRRADDHANGNGHSRHGQHRKTWRF